jgi:hypothetical protein
MSRLFIGSKDIAFISDTVKELVKDIIGQKIYYYAISTMATQIHPIYNESDRKMFENPVALDVLAGQPNWSTKANRFGVEQTAQIEIVIQAKDLLDKKMTLNEGDYFTYGDAAFEIVSYLNLNNIFGMEEYESAYKILGKLARVGEFDPDKLFLPRKEKQGSFEDQDEIQKTFEQQRGLPTDSQGNPTGDRRDLNEILGDDMVTPAFGEGAKKVDIDPVTKKSTRFIYEG